MERQESQRMACSVSNVLVIVCAWLLAISCSEETALSPSRNQKMDKGWKSVKKGSVSVDDYFKFVANKVRFILMIMMLSILCRGLII